MEKLNESKQIPLDAIFLMIFFDRNDIIVRNVARAPNFKDATDYFDSIATYTDELRKLQRYLRFTIR